MLATLSDSFPVVNFPFPEWDFFFVTLLLGNIDKFWDLFVSEDPKITGSQGLNELFKSSWLSFSFQKGVDGERRERLGDFIY